MMIERWKLFGVLLACLAAIALPACELGPQPVEPSGGDRPTTPRLRQPDTPTNKESIRIKGYSDPRNRIDLYVNGNLAGQGVANDDGKFEILNVHLSIGKNRITAIAMDWEGRKSDTSPIGRRRDADPRSGAREEVQVVYRTQDRR